MIDHLFSPAPYYARICDQRVVEYGRRRQCGEPPEAHKKPEEAMVVVHLACNGDHGEFEGQLAMVEVFLDRGAGDVEVRIEGDILDPEPFEWKCPERGGPEELHLAVFDQQFQTFGRSRHVGNFCWDATSMRLSDAQRFVKLLEGKHFTRTEWNNEGPFTKEALEAVGG